MRKCKSLMYGSKNKNELDRIVIVINILNKNYLDMITEIEKPFTVTGREEPLWKNEHFEKTDFARIAQRCLNYGWKEFIKNMKKDFMENKDNKIDQITLTIISSGPHIIPIFQFSYTYNNGEDHGNMVYNYYVETQQVEEYCVGWSGEPAYYPTKELLVEFDLNLLLYRKLKYILRHVGNLNYRT